MVDDIPNNEVIRDENILRWQGYGMVWPMAATLPVDRDGDVRSSHNHQELGDSGRG